LVKRTNVEEFKFLSQESPSEFIKTKIKYYETYLSAIKEFQDNTIYETDDPKLNLLLLISRKIVPLTTAITCFNAINQIDAVLSSIDKK